MKMDWLTALIEVLITHSPVEFEKDILASEPLKSLAKSQE